jgi:hypothetical protein
MDNASPLVICLPPHLTVFLLFWERMSRLRDHRDRK